MAAQRGRAVSSDASGADQKGCSRGRLGLGRASHHRGPMRTLPMCSAISTPLVDSVSAVTPSLTFSVKPLWSPTHHPGP